MIVTRLANPADALGAWRNLASRAHNDWQGIHALLRADLNSGEEVSREQTDIYHRARIADRIATDIEGLLGPRHSLGSDGTDDMDATSTEQAWNRTRSMLQAWLMDDYGFTLEDIGLLESGASLAHTDWFDRDDSDDPDGEDAVSIYTEYLTAGTQP